MSPIDPDALADYNAGVAKARLYYQVLPASIAARPWCAGGCGVRLTKARTGQTCRRCLNAAATRRGGGGEAG